MKHSQGILPLNSQKPSIQLLVSLMVILFVSLILVSITIFLGWIFFRIGINGIDHGLDSISSHQRAFIKFTQALQHISIFLVPALITGYLMTGSSSSYLRINSFPGITQITLVFFLALILIPLIGDLGLWNSKLSIPSWLNGMEMWMKDKEAEARILTGWLIYSDTKASLIINIIILAILPALGEEFIFRGVFQQIFSRLFRSAHLGIIFTAIIFSAFHLQFFGFVPRLVLGIVYGYLFIWSGSIWLPVLAHMLNNIVPVIAAHFIGWESMNGNIQDFMHGEGYSILIPAALCAVLLYAIRDQSLITNSSE